MPLLRFAVNTGVDRAFFTFSTKVSWRVGRTVLEVEKPRPIRPDDGASSVKDWDTRWADCTACVGKDAAPRATRSV